MKRLVLKKKIKIFVTGLFLLLMMFFAGLVDFELCWQSLAILLSLFSLFVVTGLIIIIDDEKMWEEIFPVLKK